MNPVVRKTQVDLGLCSWRVFFLGEVFCIWCGLWSISDKRSEQETDPSKRHACDEITFTALMLAKRKRKNVRDD